MRDDSLNVLLIEDNADHSALIEGYVRGFSGLTVQTAVTLQEGFQRIAADTFQAVLLDLHLPDSGGLETLEKTAARFPDLPVIVLTTIDDEEIAIESMKRGAQDYLTKDNVTGEMLHRSVRYAVERKQIETVLRSTEEQLRHSQKMEALGRVAAGVAHDFNNLLTIINGYSDELLRRLEGDPRSCRQAESIRRAGERAVKLTGQLLTFTRMQAFAPEVLDLKQLVAETAQMLPPLIGRQIDLRIVETPGDLHVRADANQLSQVILNLAINARDAMPDGGELTIETGVVESTDPHFELEQPVNPPGYALLKVSDTGVGMDRETETRIFDPFFTTKKGKGTGLGLSTVYGIVMQNGGHITVATEKGRGAAFSILLPQIDEPLEHSAERITTDRADKGEATILLVDDEDSIRELLREALEQKGYTVLDADGPKVALEICESHCGDLHLLVTDIVMPELNGYDLAKRITTRRPATKVLYISGYSDGKPSDLSQASNGVNYIQKPFSVVTFLSTVQEILSVPEFSG